MQDPNELCSGCMYNKPGSPCLSLRGQNCMEVTDNEVVHYIFTEEGRVKVGDNRK